MMTQSVPMNLIRWHYLCYVALALVFMIAAIASHHLWFLNFLHVFSGLLWTGIDLFMGFVLGPILRVVELPARKAVLLRLTPRTLFLMPTLAIITGTTGWYLAEDMGAELAAICLGGRRARAGRPHDDSGNWLFAAHEFPRLFGAAERQCG
jgi:hypothetical protein